jgi:hypothetical protein
MNWKVFRHGEHEDFVEGDEVVAEFVFRAAPNGAWLSSKSASFSAATTRFHSRESVTPIDSHMMFNSFYGVGRRISESTLLRAPDI